MRIEITFGASRRTQRVKELATNLNDLSLILEPTWFKRTDTHRLTSDLHLCTRTHN